MWNNAPSLSNQLLSALTKTVEIYCFQRLRLFTYKNHQESKCLKREIEVNECYSGDKSTLSLSILKCFNYSSLA